MPAPNEDKFAYNSEDAEIQGLSVTVGRMFAKAWQDVKNGHANMSYALRVNGCVEGYAGYGLKVFLKNLGAELTPSLRPLRVASA